MPFISLSAVRKVEEVKDIIRIFKKYFNINKGSHFPCIGFALDPELLTQGETSRKRKVDSLKVLRECLAVVRGEGFRSALHYDLRSRSLKDHNQEKIGLLEAQNFFSQDIEPLIAFVKSYCSEDTLVQLNGVLKLEALKAVRTQLPSRKIIYALKSELYRVPLLERRRHILEISTFIDYFLLDTSAGFGKPFEITQFRELREIVEGLSSVPGLAVAGGINSKNVNSRMEELASIIDPKTVSIDVESGIREERDEISIQLVEEFVKAAASSSYFKF